MPGEDDQQQQQEDSFSVGQEYLVPLRQEEEEEDGGNQRQEPPLSSNSSWASGSVMHQPQQRSVGGVSSTRDNSSAASRSTLQFKSPPRKSRRPRDNRVGSQNDDDDNEDDNDDDKHSRSVRDFIVSGAKATGTSALFGTVELLKAAGGATLSTTGRLVAPPLRVTQQVLLPSLWSAAKDYALFLTPQRVQDWVRILFSSLYHLVTVLKSTHRGRVFRQRLVSVGGDLVDCASSDASRQVITDSMATLVKLAEALNTPEARELIQQLAVLGGRLVDAAASGRNKRLIQDGKLALMAAVELAADPSTTLALAEVTATLCHTLEMEDTIYSKTHLNPPLAAQKRYERNRYQREHYLDADLVQEPDKTVEQAIVSSLGGAESTASDSLPPELYNNKRQRRQQREIPVETVDETSRDDDDDDDGDDNEEDEESAAWKKAGRTGVDSRYLEHRIAERAAAMERRQMLRTTITTTERDGRGAPAGGESGLGVHGGNNNNNNVDLEDFFPANDASPPANNRGMAVLQDSTNETKEEEEEETAGPTPRAFLEYVAGHTLQPTTESSRAAQDPQKEDQPESEVARFHKTLDDIMMERRERALETIVADGRRLGILDEDGGSVVRPNHGMDSLKRRLEAVGFAKRPTKERRSRGASGKNGTDDGDDCDGGMLGLPSKPPKRQVLPLDIVFACVGLVLFFWFLMGCIGMYMYFLSTNPTTPVVASSSTVPLTPHGSQEIVIRIVKEVVYVSPTGGEPLDSVPVNVDLNMEKVAQCIQEAAAEEEEEKKA